MRKKLKTIFSIKKEIGTKLIEYIDTYNTSPIRFLGKNIKYLKYYSYLNQVNVTVTRTKH